jgi:alpha-L-fucosidase
VFFIRVFGNCQLIAFILLTSGCLSDDKTKNANTTDLLGSGATRQAPVIAQPHTCEPLTPVQVAQRNRGYGMFIHFGVNTFNETEWSDGKLPVSSYNPTELDCDQWIRVAKEAGFRYVILVTKHHDGFCLWDSKYTEYDVAGSPVKVDVVGEVARACQKYGLELGLYYSLWDRNHPSHTDPDPTVYQDYMFKQLEELMTHYGPVCELWLDGGWAKKNDAWNIPELHRRVRSWQPDCAITVNHTIHVPGEDQSIQKPIDYQQGDPIRYWPVDMRLKDPDIARWDDPQLYCWKEDPAGQLRRLPFEHTICISERWNWFQKRDNLPVREIDELEQLFYWGTHNDNTLILNLPPDQRGRIREHEAQRVIALADRLGIRRGGPLPTRPVNQLFNAKITAASNQDKAHYAVDYSLETHWQAKGNAASLEIKFDRSTTLDQVVIHESPVTKGLGDNFSQQHTFHIQAFELQFRQNGQWITQTIGTTIGHAKRIDLPVAVTCDALRLVMTRSIQPPRIAHIAASLRSSAGLRPIYKDTLRN